MRSTSGLRLARSGSSSSTTVIPCLVWTVISLLLLLVSSVNAHGYYDRRSSRSISSFSRRGNGYDSEGSSSSGFFAFGGWSLGTSPQTNANGDNDNGDDITATQLVRNDDPPYLSANSNIDSGSDSEALPSLIDKEEEVFSPVTTQRTEMEPPTEDMPKPTKGNPFARKIGIYVRIRRPSKNSRASSSITTASVVQPATATMLDKQTLFVGASQTLIPENVWIQMTGNEFDDPQVVDALVTTGLHMVNNNKHDDNGWVKWKGSLPANIDASLDNGEILVYTGSTLQPGYGSEVPLIKSLSVLPMSAAEGASLMMDSARVTSYNSFSLGREDLKILDAAPTADNHLQQASKIVRNIVQLPVTNAKVESVAMLHTRELANGSHLLVSRAVGGTKYASGGKIGRSFILLGVNLFEPVSANECRMTAVTHVYSPGVPLMLAGKVGVKSAKSFVKDIRALCESVSQ